MRNRDRFGENVCRIVGTRNTDQFHFTGFEHFVNEMGANADVFGFALHVGPDRSVNSAFVVAV